MTHLSTKCGLLLRSCAVLLFVSQAAHAIAPEGSWWNTAYNYRQRIDLPAGASSLASGFTVSITFDHAAQVTALRSLASGDDVRIAFYNGASWVELDRIVDPASSWNSATTRIWFCSQALINAGATDDNYYIYYGNSAAVAPPANPANVYLLFDEFNGTVLNTVLWASTGPSPVILSGGVLSCPNSCQLESVASFGVDTIWEASVSLSATSGTTFNYWSASDSGNFNGRRVGFNLTGSGTHTGVTSNGVAATTQSVTAVAANTYRTYAFTREGTTAVRYFVNGTQQGATATTNVATGTLPVRVRNTAGPGTTQNYQWTRVRSYRAIEPTLAVAGREQYTAIASYRLDETTWNGTSGEVVDSSASGLPGTASGAVTANATPAITGTPGTCRYGVFDGNNDYMQVADNSVLDMSAALTVSAWVYPRSYGTELKAIVSKDTNFEFHLDNAGDVYYWWHDSGGTTRSFTSTGAAVPLNQWSHIAVTYRSGSQRIYINGVLRGSQTYTGAIAVNNVAMQIGYDGAASAQPVRYWNGYIDEVNVYGTALSQAQVQALMTAAHPCTGAAPHFVIAHDGNGIHCIAENVTVNVRNASNNPYTGYGQQITLDTGSTRGDWTLVTGGGTLNNGTANDGIATYQWSSSDTSATFSLSYREGAASININAFQTTDTTVRDDDTEGTMNWAASGFTVTSAPLSNPPPVVIPAFASPQIAGTSFPAYITAYGTTPTDPICGVIESYTGVHSLKFWPTYSNPASGTIGLIVAGVTSGTSEAAASAQNVTFTSGQSTQLLVKYKDVGQIAIGVKDDSAPTAVIRGSSSNFISRPSSIALGPIVRPNGTVNAGPISDENSSVFVAAGRPFRTTVTVRDAENSPTPNFGRETPAESVGLISALVSPTGPGSNNPSVVQVGAHTYTSGIAANVEFAWPEVGVITLTPHIQDGSYMGGVDVSGAVTVNIGRFIPDHFDMTSNTPLFQTACGTFTYLGQPFRYATAPVVTATAKAFTGETTRNYAGAYFKMSNSSVSRTYQPAASLVAGAVPAGDIAVVPLTGNPGLANITFSLGSTVSQGLAYVRTVTPVAPIPSPAPITLEVVLTDSDAVSSTPTPFVIGTGGIAFDAGSEQRYGRVAFRNAVGSELLNLPLPMKAEYFLNATSGFTVNAGDSCTSGITLAFANYGGNLSSGETCLLDTGQPGVSGLGCPVAGAIGEQFRMPPQAGDFVSILRAPGAGNGGTVTVTTVVPAWLRFDWNTATLGQENPSGIATFGLFKGEAKRIFQTEK